MIRSLTQCLVAITVSLALSSCTGGAPDKATTKGYAAVSAYFNADWAMDKHWDDGLAEVAVYNAERVVYEKQRFFEYTLITVKEDFNKEHNVKTDDYKRSDLFPVMKINQFCRIATDNYPYHYLTSVFVHRQQPWALHKITSSAQEWCGNTFKSITATDDQYEQYYNSYFDGQGEGNRQLSKELLAEDQLAYTFRSLRFEDSLAFKANVLETQQTNKANVPVIYKGSSVISRKVMLNKEAAWLVEVKLDQEKTNRYWFAVPYPNHLLQQETWDGRNLKLKSISRYAYWQD